MNIITLTKENLEREHICCAISNDKDCQVASKKQWLSERLEDGLVFKKGDVRGKCFIEYIPATKAWIPVDAPGYMYIDCLWVSGKFKGQGYSNLLLDECVRDSKEKGKKGLVILSSEKKLSFLSDSQYLKYKGFIQSDKADPYYELFYLPFDNSGEIPKFKPQVKEPQVGQNGFILYYTHQCPFTAKYVPVVERAARDKGIPFKTVCFYSAEEAQEGPAVFTTYSLFYNGEFVTHEILSDKKFQKILTRYGY